MEYPSITDLLRSWPHEPGRLNARLSDETDGRTVIQVRVELGILQIELDGRPDGLRPEGAGSLLEHHLTAARAGGGPRSLDEDACAQLRDEAALFSYRSMVRSSLDDFEGVLRDTEHNLGIAELIRACALSDRDRAHALQTLPSLLMMRARVRSTLLVRSGEIASAREALDLGLSEIEQLHQGPGAAERCEALPEVGMLREMRDLLVPKLPSSQREEIRCRLQQAISVENFELAAILRNELRQLP